MTNSTLAERPQPAASRAPLDERARRYSDAEFSPYIMHFAALCMFSAFAPVALWFAEPGLQSWAAAGLTVVSLIVLISMPFFIGSPRNVRGFRGKWMQLMLLWAVLFVVACIVPLLIPSGTWFHLLFLMGFAAVFVFMGFGSMILEHDRVTKSRRELWIEEEDEELARG